MKSDRYNVHVVEKATGQLVEVTRRVLKAEMIGNFNPIFCHYTKAHPRCLVHAVEGDLSDPFRRKESYLCTLYIEI